MFVILKAAKNPDFASGHLQGLTIPKSKIVQVESISQAQRICANWIKQYSLGAGNYAGGTVYEKGEVFGYIGYNNRFFTKAEMEVHNSLIEI